MGIYGALRDIELLGDLRGRKTLADASKHSGLSFGEHIWVIKLLCTLNFRQILTSASNSINSLIDGLDIRIFVDKTDNASIYHLP